jgi:hypothetical protein
LGFSIQSFAQEERADAKDAHQGTLTEFDVPDASPSPGLGTQAFANNDLGEVVGFYTDTNVVPHGFIRAAAGIDIDGSNVQHGFVPSREGKIATFDPADAAGTGAGQGTRPSTDNARGEVSGWYVDGHNVDHGFVWQP